MFASERQQPLRKIWRMMYSMFLWQHWRIQGPSSRGPDLPFNQTLQVFGLAYICTLGERRNSPLWWFKSGFCLQTWSFSFYTDHVAFSRLPIYFIPRDTVIHQLPPKLLVSQNILCFVLHCPLGTHVHLDSCEVPLDLKSGAPTIINSLQRTEIFKDTSLLSAIYFSVPSWKVCLLCSLKGCSWWVGVQIAHTKSSPIFQSF